MRNAMTAAMAVLTMLPGATPALAADDNDGATITTVWVDGKGQDSMARKANKVHVDMAAQGWNVQDLEVSIEDGDMKGLFVTYVRDAASAAAPAP